MKAIGRVFAFECRKLMKDLPRVIVFVLFLAAILGICFFCAYRFLGVVPGGGSELTPWTEWTEEMASKYQELADQAYRNYRIEMGEIEPQPGEIHVHIDAQIYLRQYGFYMMLIANRLPTAMNGFSEGPTHFFPAEAARAGYAYLPASRMLLFQDVAYAFLPLLILVVVCFAFSSDGAGGINPLMKGLGIGNGQRIAGKLLFSGALLLVAVLVLSSIGLVFYQDVPYAFYGGATWHLLSSVGVYYLRWLEMLLALFALLCLEAFLAELIHSVGGMVLAGLVPSVMLIPALFLISAELTGGSAFSFASYIPFLNLMCSDGPLDANALLKYLPVAGTLLLSVGGLFGLSRLGGRGKR